MHKHKHDSDGGKIVGAGLMGLIIGALAGIFFSPESGKKNREAVADWMDEMSTEVKKKTKDMGQISQDKYDDLVDTVSDKYRKLKDIKEDQIDDFVEELKDRWEEVKDKWNE